MLHQSLYEAVGHTKWVKLHELVGDPLSPEVANAQPAKKSGHAKADCAMLTLCATHGEAFKAEILSAKEV